MAVLKARISGQWVEVSAAPTELLVQEEGTALNKRGKLNFLGNRITATDDAANDRTNITISDQLYNMRGSYSGATAYLQRDIVVRFNAYWLLNVATATGVNPGESSTSWELIGGVPQMTTAQITAWTAVRNGDQVWDTTLNQLYVRDVTWIAVGPYAVPTVPKVSSYAGLARGPASDSTAYAVTETCTLEQGGLAHVVGNIEFNIVNLTAKTDLYVQVVRNRSGAIVYPAGGWFRYSFTANVFYVNVAINSYIAGTLAGDQIYVQIQRVTAGPGTWQTTSTDYRINGIAVYEGLNYVL